MGDVFPTETFEAIGVTNQVTVSDRRALAEAARIARAEVAALDLACSRFRDDSELYALNRGAGRPRQVSELLLEAIETALHAAISTDGLVDPTVEGALAAIGYDRDFEIVVASGVRPAFAFVRAGGWQSIGIDHDNRLVTVPRGSELDLGATAKALAADRIAGAVRAATGAEVLVSLGGDISISGAPPEGWAVFVTDAHRHADAPGQTVAIRAGGLATSSTTVRCWQAGELEVHHIVDPATGAPACGPWRTVSVAAPTCVEANTVATASIVLGAEAVDWLESRGLPARLVDHFGDVTAVAGWPVDREPTAPRRPFTGDSQQFLAPFRS